MKENKWKTNLYIIRKLENPREKKGYYEKINEEIEENGHRDRERDKKRSCNRK